MGLLNSRVAAPLIQIDASSSRLTRSVDGEQSFDTFAFTADSEGIEKLVPAFGSFFEVGSFRIALQPLVQFHGHRRKELTLVHSIAQVITISPAPGVARRPDLNRRHALSDGVYDLLGNALRFFRPRVGLFQACVQLL